MRGSGVRDWKYSKQRSSEKRTRAEYSRVRLMDNLCHTLVGVAMGEAGLKHKTRYANAALMIAANIPDVDVLVFLTKTPSVEFRRGWTHGIVAQLLLPIATTAAIVAYDRVRGRRHSSTGPALHVPWLLALCYLGVY